ncbi:hypothetical protein AAF712_011183 [Marasmius tenuissimus]|uniref:Uncharacterized protein n=1 Tax=Marasmius tenuissimus TaxID=585030 RepID=A0ABR2ZKR8_9AGAR
MCFQPNCVSVPWALRISTTEPGRTLALSAFHLPHFKDRGLLLLIAKVLPHFMNLRLCEEVEGKIHVVGLMIVGEQIKLVRESWEFMTCGCPRVFDEVPLARSRCILKAWKAWCRVVDEDEKDLSMLLARELPPAAPEEDKLPLLAEVLFNRRRKQTSEANQDAPAPKKARQSSKDRDIIDLTGTDDEEIINLTIDDPQEHSASARL